MQNKKAVTLTFFVVTIIVVAIGWFLYYQYHHKHLPTPKTPTVSSTVVKAQTWQAQVDAVGTLVANQGVTLKNDSEGVVTKINFRSGQLVKQGDILIELDNTTEAGKLTYSKAQYELSKLTYQRYLALVSKGSISQEQLDQAKADMDGNKGLVEEAQGDYDKKVIKAPFSGKLGLRNISLGTYLDSGDEIVNLQSLDPLFVDFNIPEKYLAQLKTGLKVSIAPDSVDNKIYDGKVHSFESVINSDTGTLAVRSQIANPNSTLLPGGYANVVLYLGNEIKVNTVPQTAIVYSDSGDYVFLVKDNKVTQQKVELGKQLGQDIIITTGLEAGQEVVSAGTNKVHDGSMINAEKEEA